MRQKAASLLLAATVLVGSSAFAEEQSKVDYSIAAIEFALTPEQNVGSVKAGLLCLPNGSLRWRDVARPEAAILVRHVEAALRDGGLETPRPIDPLYGDSSPITRYRIRVTVESVSLKLCVPGLGIGEKQPSSRGVAVIRWETFDRETRTKIASIAYDIPIDGRNRDARSDSRLIDDAISTSATLYARTQKSR